MSWSQLIAAWSVTSTGCSASGRSADSRASSAVGYLGSSRIPSSRSPVLSLRLVIICTSTCWEAAEICSRTGTIGFPLGAWLIATTPGVVGSTRALRVARNPWGRRIGRFRRYHSRSVSLSIADLKLAFCVGLSTLIERCEQEQLAPCCNFSRSS